MPSDVDVTFKDPAHEAALREQGWLTIPDALSPTALRLLDDFWARSAHLYDVSFYAGTLAMLGKSDHRAHANQVFEAAVGDVANSVLVDYRQYYGGFGSKAPTGVQATLDLHQDITMVPYDQARTSVTFWVPLCDVDEENGCIQVYPRSHLMNRHPRAAGAEFAFAAHERDIVEHKLRAVPLRRGSLLIMDQALIHMSGPNMSQRTRVALMGMYRPAEVGLVYFHRVATRNGWELEVYHVPDDFYLFHQLGTRPEGLIASGRIAETTAEAPAELTRGWSDLQSACGA